MPFPHRRPLKRSSDLPAGSYEVVARYGGMEVVGLPIEVRAGERIEQSLPLGSGVLRVTVLSHAEAEADPVHLSVRVYRAGERDDPIEMAWPYNPVEKRLPAGSYDVQVRYCADGIQCRSRIEEWVPVTVEGGKTTEISPDLGLGAVAIEVLEALGEPWPEGWLSVKLYRVGNRTEPVAVGYGGAELASELPPGTYEAVVEYEGTSLDPLSQPIPVLLQPIEVTEGQTTEQTKYLLLGRIQVIVVEENVEPDAEFRLEARLYLPGRTGADYVDFKIVTDRGDEPIELIVPAGEEFDIGLELNDQGGARLTGVSVEAGKLLRLEVPAEDFAPEAATGTPAPAEPATGRLEVEARVRADFGWAPAGDRGLHAGGASLRRRTRW